MGSLGIYVHVPFCVKKCNYCDFLSFPLKRETDCSEVENYVNALQKEICNPFKMPESPAEVDTIYLGGGTPSLLSGRQIGTILETIRRKFSVKSDAEITMECNPGTVTAESLRPFVIWGSIVSASGFSRRWKRTFSLGKDSYLFAGETRRYFGRERLDLQI